MNGRESPALDAKGEVFHHDLGRGRAAAVIRIGWTEVEATAEGRTFGLPLLGLQASITGVDLRALRLSHPARPGLTVVLAELELAKSPPLSDVETVRQALAVGSNRRRRLWGCLLAGAIALLAVIAMVLLLFDQTIEWIVRRIPAGAEQEIGDLLVSSTHEGQALINDPRVLGALQALCAPLLRDHRSVRLYVVRDESLNAYALPGGHITFHSGLLERAEQPEQVLGVLAHEMAHVSERHSMRGLVGQIGVLALARVLFGDQSRLLTLTGEVGAGLANLEFSRDLEEEADAKAVETMAQAEVDPRGLISFLELMQAAEGGQGQAIPTFLLTHPPTAKRMKTLSDAVDTLPHRARPRLRSELELLQDALREAERSG